jgi:hypothetical protein
MRRIAVQLALVGALAAGSPDAGGQAIQNLVLRNSFNPLGAGARGLGMGGAFIAVADDGTAASFNPAGLAQLRRTEIAVVGFRHRLTSDLTFVRPDTGPGTSSSSSTHGAPDFIGLAVPFEVGGKRLTVQLSYQRSVDLFGRGTAVTQDTFPLSELGLDPRELGLPASFRFGTLVADIRPDQAGAFHTVVVSSGYQLTSRLSAGVAVDYWIGEWTSRGEGTFRLLAATAGAPGQPPRTFELFRERGTFVHEQSLRGLNLTSGLLLRYPRLSLGAVLRLPFTGDYDLSQQETSQAFQLGEPQESSSNDLDLRSRLRWPRSAGVGLAVRPVRGLTLAADYTRSHWSRTSIEAVPEGALLTSAPQPDEDGNTPAPAFRDLNFFDLQPASQTTTLDTSQWRAGAEYLVSLPKLVVPLRAGLFRDRSPVRQIGSDGGRLVRGWTVGTGLNFSRVVLDVAFERRRSEALVGLVPRAGVANPQAVAPSERVVEDRLVASLIWRFGGADDPLQRALRFLFVGPKDDADGGQ